MNSVYKTQTGISTFSTNNIQSNRLDIKFKKKNIKEASRLISLEIID